MRTNTVMTYTACCHVLLSVVVYIMVLSTQRGNANISPQALTDYCEGETFKAQCGDDEVVMMDRATYGRMQLGRCVRLDMGYLGCSENVRHVVDAMCSGRRSCEIRIPDKQLDFSQACLEMKSYLEASYKCVKVLNSDKDCSKSHAALTAKTGRISSLSNRATWCVGSDMTWTIKAMPGQRINVTLIDFNHLQPDIILTSKRHRGTSDNSRNHDTAWSQANKNSDALESKSPTSRTTGEQDAARFQAAKSSATQHGTDACRRYGAIAERSPYSVTPICGGRHRVQHIHTTNSNVVDIHIEARHDADFFLVEYEVIGCADPEVSSDAWFRRDNNEITVGCKSTQDKWKRRCVGDDWSGDVGNCSKYESLAVAEILMQEHTATKPFVVATVFALSTVVVVVLAAVLLLALYRRRQRHRQGSSSHYQPTPMSPKVFVRDTVEADIRFMMSNGHMIDPSWDRVTEEEPGVVSCGRGLQDYSGSTTRGRSLQNETGSVSKGRGLLDEGSFTSRGRDIEDESCLGQDIGLSDDTAGKSNGRSAGNDVSKTPRTQTGSGGYLKGTGCSQDNKYMHIWQMPLPTPGE